MPTLGLTLTPRLSPQLANGAMGAILYQPFPALSAAVLATTAVVTLLPSNAGGQVAVSFRGTPFPDARVEEIGQSLALGLVVGMAATRDGEVLIVDRSTSKVLRVARNGEAVVTYGGPGDGPGEFRAPYRVAERSDGSVIVFDLANERFSEFSADGRFVRRWATSARIVSIGSIVPLPDRAVAITGIVRDPRAAARAVHVFDSTFQLVRSFGPLSRARSRELLEQWIPGDLRTTRAGNLLYLRLTPYELYWYSPEGRLVKSVAVPKRVIATVDEFFSVRRSGTTVTTRTERGRPYPLWALPLRDGRILAARTDAGVKYWDMIDAAGRVVHSGRAPALLGGPVQLHSSTSDEAWFTGTTGDGEPVLYFVQFAER